MVSRGLSDWISAYLEYVDDTEPPLSYHIWTSVSLIAASLQRKVYIRWGHETIYPNMYIVLIGPSGKCRKGTAMAIGRDLLTGISKIKICAEAITPEALIRMMKDATDNVIDPQNPSQIKFHCSVTAFSAELSVFLGQNDLRFLSHLTDWYDSNDLWEYRTKNAGVDEINGICFNLLGATAPDWLQSILPAEAIGGGFTSRIIFVVEEEKRKIVPKPMLTEMGKKLRVVLKEDLERINTLVGEITFTPEAENIYMSWYEEQNMNMKAGRPPIKDPRFAGYCERRATHIRKLCMVFSASRGNDMIITSSDFERSHELLKKTEVKMVKVFGGLGSAKYSHIIEKVLQVLIKEKTVKRSELLRLFYRDLDSETLTIIEDTLSKMKVIKISLDLVGNEVTYTFIGKDMI